MVLVQQFVGHERLIGVVGVSDQRRDGLGCQVHGGGDAAAGAGHVVVVEQFGLPVVLRAAVRRLVVVQAAGRAMRAPSPTRLRLRPGNRGRPRRSWADGLRAASAGTRLAVAKRAAASNVVFPKIRSIETLLLACGDGDRFWDPADGPFAGSNRRLASQGGSGGGGPGWSSELLDLPVLISGARRPAGRGTANRFSRSGRAEE